MQMAACRLARREPSEYANAALQSLARERPFPTDGALPWRIWAALQPQNKVKRGTKSLARNLQVLKLMNPIQRLGACHLLRHHDGVVVIPVVRKDDGTTTPGLGIDRIRRLRFTGQIRLEDLRTAGTQNDYRPLQVIGERVEVAVVTPAVLLVFGGGRFPFRRVLYPIYLVIAPDFIRFAFKVFFVYFLGDLYQRCSGSWNTAKTAVNNLSTAPRGGTAEQWLI